MRLLNTKTFDVEDFDDPKNIRYAILSHRWVDGKELTFQDLQNLANFDKSRVGEPEKVSKSHSPIPKGVGVPIAWRNVARTRLATIHDFQLFFGS